MTGRDDLKTWFSEAVGKNMDSCYGLAFRLTCNRAEAEDLVADSVARAWAAIATLEDRKRFRPWLLRILHNCFISGYRKKSVRPVELAYADVSVSEGEDEISALMIRQPDDFMLWWANPEREFINSLLGETIMSAIDSLAEPYRLTVLLVNVEGLSYDDTAEVLGVPPGTVRSRMKRGRTLLQKALWQQAVDEGLVTAESERGKQ